ncbi:GNAT family N-acetyltransferase [Kibdelosporangium philippinense]|uniref:GNAT family N-acetyltransferase n=1 Tax=Kibdelosporangium philippinense TaxID=211113 RepID=A0ABS8Z9A1_9PSEU|nr:GNAT family N-acetyltransferase [Kibdelosporangium philippinense]MCE7002427.1 GNAT family N-acetyltransferase [Kibdelosporangium philippinense]
MRVVFSECAPNYETYLAPYQVLGFLDEGESPATAFSQGMLPGNRELTRFYLTRSVRIDLGEYSESKRERYVRRQCSTLRLDVFPKAELAETDSWVKMCLGYMNESPQWESRRARPFEPEDVTTRFDMALATHLLTLTDTSDGTPVALAILYVEPPIAYYVMAFYDARYRNVSIGWHLMSRAIGEMQRQGLSHVYLGTCYYEGALYKTRFAGLEFFDGIGWSDDRDRLRFLLSQQDKLNGRHMFEYPPYLEANGPIKADDAVMRLL